MLIKTLNFVKLEKFPRISILKYVIFFFIVDFQMKKIVLNHRDMIQILTNQQEEDKGMIQILTNHQEEDKGMVQILINQYQEEKDMIQILTNHHQGNIKITLV
jgi:hypothetical protein